MNNDLIKRSDVIEAIRQTPKFIEDMFGKDDEAIFVDDLYLAIDNIPAIQDHLARIDKLEDEIERILRYAANND